MLDTNLLSPDMREFTYHLLNDKLFLPDIFKDMKRVMEMAPAVFASACQPFAIVGGDNKIGGVFYITDVIPGHEANLYIWVWNGKVVTSKTLPFIREYIEATAEEYGLCRLVARTPCKKLCHLLKHLGLTEEARLKFGFKSGGRLMTLFQFRRLFSR
jgi:hypothetical protein